MHFETGTASLKIIDELFEGVHFGGNAVDHQRVLVTLCQGALETVVLTTAQEHGAIVLLGCYHRALPVEHTVIVVNSNQ